MEVKEQKVLISTGLRVGPCCPDPGASEEMLVVCSDFSAVGLVGFFVEEAKLGERQFCPSCKVEHKVLGIVEAFERGFVAVGEEEVDFAVPVAQLVTRVVRAELLVETGQAEQRAWEGAGPRRVSTDA